MLLNPPAAPIIRPPSRIIPLLTSSLSFARGLYVSSSISGDTALSERAILMVAGATPSSERTPRRRVCIGSVTEIKSYGATAESNAVAMSAHSIFPFPSSNVTVPVTGAFSAVPARGMKLPIDCSAYHVDPKN